MRKIKFNNLLKAVSACAILAGGFISINALAYGTCTVQDANGRTWTQVGPYPCTAAQNSCLSFHQYARGTSGATCHVISGPTPIAPPPIVPPAPPVPPVMPPPGVPPVAPMPAITCYVHDNAGRSWHWTGGSNPCGQAYQACVAWHQNRGYASFNCYTGS